MRSRGHTVSQLNPAYIEVVHDLHVGRFRAEHRDHGAVVDLSTCSPVAQLNPITYTLDWRAAKPRLGIVGGL